MGWHETLINVCKGHVRITAEELGGECKIFARQTGGQNTTIEFTFSYGAERRPLRCALEGMYLEFVFLG